MTLVTAFADYLQSKGVATRGTDLFTSRAPSSKTLQAIGHNPDRIFWIKSAPGAPPERSVDGHLRQIYGIEVYHRNLSADAVDEALQALSDKLGCSGCVHIPGYNVFAIEVDGPWSDQDLDNEERTVGLLQVTITIEKEC